MHLIRPIGDIVIVKEMPMEEQAGAIILPGNALEKSTLCEVLIPNEISYHRDGTRRDPFLKAGQHVRIPKGNIGTQMPEAPKGQTWLAIPEDCILYIVEAASHDNA